MKMIELPEAGLSLEKLPPIHDNVDLPGPPLPAPRSVVKQNPKIYPRGSYPPAVKKKKEPKFVPYEPYKGAVAFMEKVKRAESSKSLRSNKSLDNEVFEESNNSVCDSNESEEKQTENSSELEKNFRVMLDIKEKEIERLKKALENQEKQLKIQTKVNEEVKRLLVASVGEDIEAKVEFLTQDKARLAADVLEYNNRIAIDYERKEELGVEKDVWRSKFLASTVIVDELTKTRQNVIQRVEDLEHSSRKLLLERTNLKQNLGNTQLKLNKLSLSFDPTLAGSLKTTDHGLDSLQLSELLLRSVDTLSTRLLGEAGAKSPIEAFPAVHVTSDTPAEADLKRLLSRPLKTDGKVPDQASLILAKDARPHLLKLGDMAASPHGDNQFETCSHCSGSVQNV